MYSIAEEYTSDPGGNSSRLIRLIQLLRELRFSKVILHFSKDILKAFLMHIVYNKA